MPIDAVGLLSELPPSKDRTYAAHHIFQARNRLQMIWVHAVSYSAEVIDLQLLGDRSYHRLVRDAMRHPQSASYPKLPVPVPILAGKPCPAARRADIHLGREPVDLIPAHDDHDNLSLPALEIGSPECSIAMNFW